MHLRVSARLLENLDQLQYIFSAPLRMKTDLSATLAGLVWFAIGMVGMRCILYLHRRGIRYAEHLCSVLEVLKHESFLMFSNNFFFLLLKLK